jgi:hypothetical protein
MLGAAQFCFCGSHRTQWSDSGARRLRDRPRFYDCNACPALPFARAEQAVTGYGILTWLELAGGTAAALDRFPEVGLD